MQQLVAISRTPTSDHRPDRVGCVLIQAERKRGIVSLLWVTVSTCDSTCPDVIHIVRSVDRAAEYVEESKDLHPQVGCYLTDATRNNASLLYLARDSAHILMIGHVLCRDWDTEGLLLLNLEL